MTTTILILFLIQGAMGAADTLWHHELGAQLTTRPSARIELGLHAAREAIYAVVFLTLGWVAWRGAWALLLALLMAVEVVITLTDFLEEDRTRRLAPSERVLHALMAIGFGALLAALAPVLVGWERSPTALVFNGHGALSWAMTLVGLGVLAWAVRDGLAMAQQPAALDRSPPQSSGRTVLVTGATGFIGRALVAQLQQLAYRVVVLARDPMQARAQFGPTVVVLDDLHQIPPEAQVHAIVNLAGASIAGGLWTRGRRRALLESRLVTTRALVGLIVRLERKPRVLINASAVGFYGDRGDEELTEASDAATGFMSELCQRWEATAAVAEVDGVRVCRLRLGLVMDWSGGILPLLALPARFAMAAIMGSGRQWMAWVHLQDVLEVIAAAIVDDRYDGAINVVAPELVRQAEFTRALAWTLGRPQWLKVPAWPLKLALGEMSDLFLASQRIEPRRLTELGFAFRKGELALALAPHPPADLRSPGPSLSQPSGARGWRGIPWSHVAGHG